MSLDVYLYGPAEECDCICSKCGKPHRATERDEIYSANMTHNLNQMAHAASIYEEVWRPDEIGITTAAQLIAPLTAGIALLEADPDRFRQFDAPNGWGTYDSFVQWLKAYLRACEANPDATVEVSR